MIYSSFLSFDSQGEKRKIVKIFEQNKIYLKGYHTEVITNRKK